MSNWCSNKSMFKSY